MIGRGYDHNWVLDRRGSAAGAGGRGSSDPASGRVLDGPHRPSPASSSTPATSSTARCTAPAAGPTGRATASPWRPSTSRTRPTSELPVDRAAARGDVRRPPPSTGSPPTDRRHARRARQRLQMSKVDPVVEQAVETLGLNRVTRRRLLGGVGLASASLAASALLAACSNNDDSSSSDAAAAAPATSRRPRSGSSCSSTTSPPTRSSPPPSTAPRTPARCSTASSSGPGRQLDRRRDGQRHEHRDLRQGGRDRARGGRQGRLQRAGQPGAGGRHPGRLLQRRRRPGRPRHQPPGLHRPGPVRLRVRSSASGRSPRAWSPARWSASSPPRAR